MSASDLPAEILPRIVTSSAPADIVTPISGRSVTCAVRDAILVRVRSFALRAPGRYAVVEIEPDEPLRFLRAIVTQLRAGRIVHLELPVEGWGNHLLPGVALFFARLVTRRGRILFTQHEWLSLHPLRFLSILPNLYAADRVAMASPREIEAFGRAWYLPRRLRERVAHVPTYPNLAKPVLDAARVAEWARRLRRDLGGRAPDVVIGYFGVLYDSKQPHLMVEAVAALRDRGVRARLVLAGDFLPDRAEDADAFTARIASLGIEEHVDRLGRVESETEVFELLQACDVHLFLFSDGATSRRSSLVTSLQLDRPIVTTAPLQPNEFDHLPEVDAQITGGAITLVPASADADSVAGALARIAEERPTRPPIDTTLIVEQAVAALEKAYAELERDAA